MTDIMTSILLLIVIMLSDILPSVMCTASLC
jgi:hypothetical protein